MKTILRAFDPVVLPSFAVASALSFGLNADAVPPQYYPADAKVEQLYKVDGRIVGPAILSAVEADKRCPEGAQTVREASRQEGGREYLVWHLRCRNLPR